MNHSSIWRLGDPWLWETGTPADLSSVFPLKRGFHEKHIRMFRSDYCSFFWFPSQQKIHMLWLWEAQLLPSRIFLWGLARIPMNIRHSTTPFIKDFEIVHVPKLSQGKLTISHWPHPKGGLVNWIPPVLSGMSPGLEILLGWIFVPPMNRPMKGDSNFMVASMLSPSSLRVFRVEMFIFR